MSDDRLGPWLNAPPGTIMPIPKGWTPNEVMDKVIASRLEGQRILLTQLNECVNCLIQGKGKVKRIVLNLNRNALESLKAVEIVSRAEE